MMNVLCEWLISAVLCVFFLMCKNKKKQRKIGGKYRIRMKFGFFFCLLLKLDSKFSWKNWETFMNVDGKAIADDDHCWLLFV